MTPQTATLKGFVSAKQLAEMLGLSHRHVAERLTRSEGFPKEDARLGCFRLWTENSIERYLLNLKQSART